MNIALLLAAGSSTRAGQNKLWTDVQGEPLWTLAYKIFLAHPEVDRIVLVVPKGEELRFLPFINNEKTLVTVGGATRMESFKKGLEALEAFAADDIILDHNAASPFVTAEEISGVIAAAEEHGASAVAHAVVDTVAEVQSPSEGENPNCYILTIRDRSNLRLMQTPQAVRGDILEKARASLIQDATDLSSGLLKFTKVVILPAHPRNKKITTAEDLAALSAHTTIGEDSHRFLTGASAEGTQLTLGGLTVSDCPALEANSDGDVILHAIGRALATAQNKNFSELADPLMLGGDSDSRDYLEPLLSEVKIRQVSLSLECARPKIDPLISDLKSSLGRILQIEDNQIHISAHSGEDLTPFGRGEGIRCLASVTLK